MRDLVILFIHLLTTAARLAGRGGLRSVVAESVLLKHQLLILNRSRQRAPHLRLSDRLVTDKVAEARCEFSLGVRHHPVLPKIDRLRAPSPSGGVVTTGLKSAQRLAVDDARRLARCPSLALRLKTLPPLRKLGT